MSLGVADINSGADGLAASWTLLGAVLSYLTGTTDRLLLICAHKLYFLNLVVTRSCSRSYSVSVFRQAHYFLEDRCIVLLIVLGAVQVMMVHVVCCMSTPWCSDRRWISSCPINKIVGLVVSASGLCVVATHLVRLLTLQL